MNLATRWLTLLLLMVLAGSAHALSDEPLQPEEAFRVEASVEHGDTLLLRWTIAPDYYLYRDKFRIRSDSKTVSLGTPQIPPGQIKHDEFFGDIAILHDQALVRVSIARNDSAATEIAVDATAQGCWEGGVCYPPTTRTLTVTLPAAATPTLVEQLLGDTEKPLAHSTGGDEEFLDPDEAFALSTHLDPDGNLVAEWSIAPGYYLYRNKFKVKVVSGNAEADALELPPGEEKQDEFFGLLHVFHEKVTGRVPLTGSGPVELELGYQGCAEVGLCYPPITKTVSYDLPSTATSGPKPAVAPLSEQDRLAGVLAKGDFLVTVALFFGAGLLLAFTPCVFPMIPILSGIIVGQGHKLTTGRAFTLSGVYVLAMAVAYTAAGVIAALLGENLQAAFQNPWVLGSFSLVFVLLALSMFGFYELQLPAALQSRIATASNRQQGGSLAGVGVMGLLSALIVGPCVAPPLMGALIYIGRTGDALLGGAALFAMSLGMGLPLLAIGTSAGKLLPKAGAWMDTVKAVFGVAMLAVAVWMLERILPGQVTMLLWAALAIVSAVYMGVLEPIPAESSGWRRLWKGCGALLAAWGILLLVGAATGNTDPLEPLRGLGRGPAVAHAGVPVEGLAFRRIKSEADLDREVAAAGDRGQPVMLDFYADWCVSCKEMEKHTFRDAGVQRALQNALLLQADVTGNDAIDKALLRRFELVGPPSILFYGPDGVERPAHRVVGYMAAEAFRDHVRRAIAP